MTNVKSSVYLVDGWRMARKNEAMKIVQSPGPVKEALDTARDHNHVPLINCSHLYTYLLRTRPVKKILNPLREF